MNDRFLEIAHVSNEKDALRETLKASLAQRQNRVYARDEVRNEREVFRAELAKFLREISNRYTPSSQPVSETQHCEAIRTISETLSRKFGTILKDGRFRYGTSQKALNLYLKFLWRMNKIAMPPHCTVDGVVLKAAGISGSWTWSDSEEEYIAWIRDIKIKAAGIPLAQWEYDIWLRSEIETSRVQIRKCS